MQLFPPLSLSLSTTSCRVHARPAPPAPGFVVVAAVGGDGGRKALFAPPEEGMKTAWEIKERGRRGGAITL